MCAMSMVADYGQRYPIDYWTPDKWAEFQRLARTAIDFDIKTGQPDCESAEKTAWMKQVEDRLKQLEEEKAALMQH